MLSSQRTSITSRVIFVDPPFNIERMLSIITLALPLFFIHFHPVATKLQTTIKYYLMRIFRPRFFHLQLPGHLSLKLSYALETAHLIINREQATLNHPISVMFQPVRPCTKAWLSATALCLYPTKCLISAPFICRCHCPRTLPHKPPCRCNLPQHLLILSIMEHRLGALH